MPVAVTDDIDSHLELQNVCELRQCFAFKAPTFSTYLKTEYLLGGGLSGDTYILLSRIKSNNLVERRDNGSNLGWG
jgi:hypothetical protein